jgi:poly(3-hydroxyalkanoate) depolymerase
MSDDWAVACPFWSVRMIGHSAPEADGDRWVRTVLADGLAIRVCTGGSGAPLLLIMGIGGHLDMWVPLERILHRSGIRTISYDAPGTGGSQPYRTPHRIGRLVRTTQRLLDTLGVGEVDVLGVSFGGGVAQQLALQLPSRVRRLVLAATSTGALSFPGHPAALLALATPRRYFDPAYYHRIAPKVFGGLSRHNPEAAAAARFSHPPSITGYVHQLYAAAGWTSLWWLHRIRQPTLVLAGDDDPIVPLANGRLLASRIPDARLHVVAGGGHLFLLEQADVIGPVIADFLAEPAAATI